MMKGLAAGLAAAASFLGTPVLAVEAPGPLVTPAWLEAHRSEVVILQVEPVKAFTAAPEFRKAEGRTEVVSVGGHVPGARSVDFETIRIDRVVSGKKVKSIPSREGFEKLARSWGVDRDSFIVIVPKGTSTLDVDEATRLYWQFKYYGQTRMAILNGGMAAWLAAGFPFSTAAPTASAGGNWSATAENRDILATYDDVKSAVARHDMQLADARPQDQYMGVVAKKDEEHGHIPGARDISPDLITAPSGPAAEFLPVGSYKSIMQAKGLNPDAPTIDYCNTGHLASGLWFVSHELLGNANARLYDGSFLEYSVLGGEAANPAAGK